MSESNEQFHIANTPGMFLARYFWGTHLDWDNGVAPAETRESAYLESLGWLNELVGAFVDDPRQRDLIMREVMPPRFDESDEVDVELWQNRLQLVPNELIGRGHIPLDHEKVTRGFVSQLVDWTLYRTEGHAVGCADECQHELVAHRESCPVRGTVRTLGHEIQLLQMKLHGEYTLHAALNRLDFLDQRIEMIGDVLVAHRLCERQEMEEFLLENEDKAIIYGAIVNGLDTFEE